MAKVVGNPYARSQGFNFIPGNQYLQNDFTTKKPTIEEQKITQTFGIPATNAFTNSGGMGSNAFGYGSPVQEVNVRTFNPQSNDPTGKIANAQSQLDDAIAAGGNIDRIAIESTATATGVRPDGEEKFINQMNSAGFPKYAQIENFEKDTDLGVFSEMEVTSADRALAVARGKYLAKQLGFTDDQVDYTFTLVDGIPGGEGKIVTLKVTGQGEDSQELLTKGTRGQSSTSASGGETFSTTDTGSLAKLIRAHIQLQKK